MENNEDGLCINTLDFKLIDWYIYFLEVGAGDMFFIFCKTQLNVFTVDAVSPKIAGKKIGGRQEWVAGDGLPHDLKLRS